MTDPASAPKREITSLSEVLRTQMDKTVTIVNVDALKGTPTGYGIGHAIYRARVRGVSDEMVTIITEFTHSGLANEAEPAKEFIPIAQIKRVSVTKQETHVHI